MKINLEKVNTITVVDESDNTIAVINKNKIVSAVSTTIFGDQMVTITVKNKS